MVNTPYTGTYTGKRINLLEPAPDDIDLRDITTALDRLPRWTGHTEIPYSVLQHSLACHAVVKQYLATSPMLLLATLLHDAHEAYMGDIATPVAIAIGSGVGQLKTRLQSAIHRHFGLPERLSDQHLNIIKFADRTMAAWEWTHLMRRAALNMDLGIVGGHESWMPRASVLRVKLNAIRIPGSSGWRAEFTSLVAAYAP